MLAEQVFKVLLGLAAATRVAANPSSPLDKLTDVSGPYKGVNLGGWLVTEPWITPSLFEEAGEDAVDEYTLSQTLGATAQARLAQHWNSWITADDFAKIAKAGLTHVRIPIGYWAVNPRKGDPYVQGQLEMMDKAIKWARNSKLGVIVDLHGAPGSQNGFDNSGRRGPVKWQSGDNVNQTVEAISRLSEHYAQDTDVVAGIELLNEPAPQEGVKIKPLKTFHQDGYAAVREPPQEKPPPDTPVIISDAFEGVKTWNGFMTPADNFHKVIVDTHHYEVFDSAPLANSIEKKAKEICKLGRDDIAQGDKPAICGEWSGALTDCAKYLNGRGGYRENARYDGSYPDSSFIGSCDNTATGSAGDLPQGDQDNIRQFIEAQLDAYEMGAGWFFWTWKTEGAPGWDLQDLLATGLFPQPLDSRKYPGQCG